MPECRIRSRRFVPEAMHIQLPYDDRQTLDLDISADALVAGLIEPHGETVIDVRAAVDRVLADPLDFPPLREAVVSGDRVAITLDGGVPQVETIVASVVDELLEAEVEPGDIEIVQTPDAADRQGPDPRSGLSSSIAKQVRLSTHDPSAREVIRKFGHNSIPPKVLERPQTTKGRRTKAGLIVPLGLRPHRLVRVALR